MLLCGNLSKLNSLQIKETNTAKLYLKALVVSCESRRNFSKLLLVIKNFYQLSIINRKLDYLSILCRKCHNIVSREEALKEYIAKRCRKSITEVCEAVINKNLHFILFCDVYCICQLFKICNVL